MKLKANLRLNKLSRVGGWLEQLGIKLISTQVVVEVKVGVELGKKKRIVKIEVHYRRASQQPEW